MAATNTATAKPAETESQKPANIPAATEIKTSGAPQQVVPGVDMSHPAVDSNPRAGTTVDQNRIDFTGTPGTCSRILQCGTSASYVVTQFNVGSGC